MLITMKVTALTFIGDLLRERNLTLTIFCFAPVCHLIIVNDI